MSTASPLPLEPLPPTVPESEADRRKREITARLQEHRRRRPAAAGTQAILSGLDAEAPRLSSRGKGIAGSVAARFAQSLSYREFLEQEAEAATRQAEAAAEVARRNAEAVAKAQAALLQEIEQWNRRGEPPANAVAQSALPEPQTAVPAEAPSFALEPLSQKRDMGHPDPPPIAEVVRIPVLSAVPTPVAPVPIEAAAPAVVDPVLPLEPLSPLATNLIEFPRQLVAARKARPRHAEGPLREDADSTPERAQLRIFEVEASSFSTTPEPVPASALPEWSSIRLDNWREPHETATPDSQVSFALPIHTAPVSQRCMAAMVDGCCIATAFLGAVTAAAYASTELPAGLFAVASSLGVLLFFTAGYFLLFFSLAEATPGMRYARIALCTFGDDNPTRSAMRRRIFATVLAAIPMGLGFAWALFDDDRLGWHDRISRMYQRAY